MLRKLLHNLNVLACRAYLILRRELYKWRMPKATEPEKIIVSMTSWEKRINNVPVVIDSILKNTVQPDKIVLNLSLEEFPNREADLPEEVVNLKKGGIIEIGWQEGNTKAFKKIIPTMKKYPNDAIISIDDDFLYPEDFIETFVNMHKKFPHNPLSGNKVEIFGVKAHCGCASLAKAEYFGEYIETLKDNDVIRIGADDAFYTMCAALNGVHYLYLGKTFFYNMQEVNPIDGISATIGGKAIYKMHDYLMNKVNIKYGINIEQLDKLLFVNPFRK